MRTDSQIQEQRVAALFGGLVNSGSGNTTGHKNDVRTREFSIECKFTKAKGFRITLDMLQQAWKHALLDGRDMLFDLEFATEETHHRKPVHHAFIVIRELDFAEIINRLHDAERDREYLLRYLPEGEYLE